MPRGLESVVPLGGIKEYLVESMRSMRKARDDTY